MADDITYTSSSPAGLPNSTKQVTDEHVTRGHMPVVKIAYSADGDATLVTADANGLEVQLGASIPAGTNNIGDVDVLTLPALPAGSNNIGDVDVLSLVPGTSATSLGKAVDSAAGATDTGVAILAIRDDALTTLTPVDGDYTNARTNIRGALWVAIDDTSATNIEGDTAHDAADTGNPVKIGGKARTSDNAVVSNSDRVDALFDTYGRIVTAPYTLHENLVSGVTAAITTTSDTSVIAAGGAGIRNYITSISVVNSHASVSTVVEIKDGSSVIHRGYALAGGGGYQVTLPTPLRSTSNTAINAACVTNGANVYVSASGYRSAT